jgi:hypothetical protein
MALKSINELDNGMMSRVLMQREKNRLPIDEFDRETAKEIVTCKYNYV